MSSLTFYIVNKDDLTYEQVLNSMAQNETYMRKSLDESKVLIKTENSSASCYSGLTPYTHEEILVELDGTNWKDAAPETFPGT